VRRGRRFARLGWPSYASALLLRHFPISASQTQNSALGYTGSKIHGVLSQLSSERRKLSMLVRDSWLRRVVAGGC
jgi:hypothetical protein